MQQNQILFLGNLPRNVEYENKKQKMDTLITTRTDRTHLYGKVFMNKLTIRKIRFLEKRQLGKKVLSNFSHLFENNKATIVTRRYEPGHYPIIQKAKLIPSHLQETAETERSRSSRKTHESERKLFCISLKIVITVKTNFH